jgi:hypothetical protein
METGRCLGPEGNGVTLGRGVKAGPAPQKAGKIKQSTLNEEGGNLEKEV